MSPVYLCKQVRAIFNLYEKNLLILVIIGKNPTIANRNTVLYAAISSNIGSHLHSTAPNGSWFLMKL